jgi:lipoprotein NlpD
VKLATAGVLLIAAVLAAGCTTRGRAPVVDRAPKPSTSRPAQAPAPTPAPQIVRSESDYYTVKRGDTLYSIALEHGADYREVAQWNQLDDPTMIRVGQQLRVTPPEPDRAAVQVGSVRPPGRVEARPLETPAKPAAASPPVPAPAPAAASPPVAVQPPAVAATGTLFMWPAKGKVLAEFAGPRKKGIDIDGRPGDPIVAAAAGRVTYIGTGIPGMGKLVVIKHDNGYITVYAHNRDIFVREQQAVARGQKIAELGSTDAERPKLHFQIRKGAAAVDPLLYLPKT